MLPKNRLRATKKNHKIGPRTMKIIRKNSKSGSKGCVEWPQGRSGHRVTASDNYLYVYGGYSNWNHRLFRELWRFNFTLGTWTLNLSQEGFPEHVASSSTAKIGQYLLVFGGTAFPFGGNNSNELHVVDLSTGEIVKQRTTGDIPTRSYGHGCAVDEVNKKLYIVGGTTGVTFSSEVHCLDLISKEWKHLKSKNDEMEPRYRHEIALYNDKLFVFGGGTTRETFSLSDIPYFDLETNRWESVISTEADLGSGNYSFPERRKCHSGVLVPAIPGSDAKYIISGGVYDLNQLNDIWSINLRTMQWSKFKTKLPQKMHFHDAALTSSGKMAVFGGLKINSNGVEKRLNDLALCNVFIPQLQELAWESLLENYPMTKKLSTKVLKSIGIPPEFVKRVF